MAAPRDVGPLLQKIRTFLLGVSAIILGRMHTYYTYHLIVSLKKNESI
jgi:hypothetical protein